MGTLVLTSSARPLSKCTTIWWRFWRWLLLLRRHQLPTRGPSRSIMFQLLPFTTHLHLASRTTSTPCRKKRSVLAYSLPLTATLPAYAKSTVKTAYYEANEAALTPAATTKIDLKEQEHEILTPVAYHTPLSYRVPVVSAAPVATRVLTTSPYLGYGYHVIG